MNKMKWLGLVLVIAIGTHIVFLFATPYLMMAGLDYFTSNKIGYGKLSLSKQAEHGTDKIVRISPDLLYSYCAFQLKDGPLRVRSSASSSYMSLAFYGYNTDNFFSINDKQALEGFDLVLAKRGSQIDLPKGATLLETDSPYGLITFRYYLGNQQASDLDTLRESASCEILETPEK